MRIVAGTCRGRTIEAPVGEGTRPTIDRVREALFSSLYSMRGGFDDAVVLDAFAGSGALGLEALSRGAASATFYERDPKAAATCVRNIAACGMDERASIVRRDVLKVPPTSQTPPFDLVFLDPPYADDPECVLAMVRALLTAGAVSKSAIVVYEHAIKEKEAVVAAAEAQRFTVEAARKYGKTGIAILKEHE